MPILAPLVPFIPAIAAVAAAGIGAFAANSAAKTQAAAADRATATQTGMYDQVRNDLAPYRAFGNNALGSISGLYGYGGSGTPDYSAFTSSPDYNFALDQGVKGLDRSATAKGALKSGGHTKDVLAFASGLAAQQYGNYFNRLMAMAGLGAEASSGSASGAAQFANAIGSSQMASGAANASGPVGVANALSTLPQNLLYAQMIGQMGKSSYPMPTPVAAPNFAPRGNQFVGFSPYGNVG